MFHSNRAELKKQLESLKEALASRFAAKRAADHMLFKVARWQILQRSVAEP